MGKQSTIITEQAVLSADPPSPPVGFSVVYPKSDGKWYVKDSSGTITEITNNANAAAALRTLRVYEII